MLTTPRFTTESPAPVALLGWLGRQLLAAILILVLAIVTLISFLMVNRQELLRRVVVLHLRYILRRDVMLGEITLDPRGQAVLTNLIIYDGLGSRRRAWSARQVDLRFDPLHLTAFPKTPLSAVRSVAIDDPYLIVTRDRNGRWNFDDLLKPRRITRDRFRGEVSIRNGEVIFRDDKGFLPGSPPIREHLVHLNMLTTRAGGEYMPFRVSALSVAGQVHAFSATGSLHTAGRGEGEIRLGQIDLGTLRKYLPSKLPVTLTAGQADARIQFMVAVNPRTKRVAWQGTVVMDLRDVRGSFTPQHTTIPCTVERGQLRYADGAVELVDLQGTCNGVALRLDGTVANFAHPILAVQVSGHDASTDAFLTLIPGLRALPYTFSGKADGWMRIVGPPDDLQIYGYLSGPSIQTPFGEFHELKGNLSYTSDSLQITNATAYGFGGAFNGSLWSVFNTASGPRVLVNGDVTGVGIRQLARQFLPEELDHPSGLVPLSDIDGTLSGPLTVEMEQNGQVTLAAHARGDVEIAGLTHGEVDGSLRMEIDDNEATTRIERLSARTPEGLFQAQGTIASDRTTQLAVRGSGLDLAAFGTYFNQRDLRGTGFLAGDIDGPPERLAFTGALHVQDGEYARRTFTDLYSDVQAVLAPTPTVALRNLRLITGGTQLALPETHIIADTAHNAWSAEGKVLLPRTTLAALGKALDIDLPLDGLIEGDAEFNLTENSPAVGGTLRLRYPVLHAGADIECDEAKLTFALDHDTLTITDGEISYRETPFNVTGAITLDPATRRPTGLDLRLRAKAVGFDVLTKFVDSKDPLLGKLTQDLRVALPVDVDGHFDLDATLTAKLPPGVQLTADTLGKTLTVTVSATQTGDLKVAGIPYTHFVAELEYQGKGELLTVRRLNLARDAGNRNYRITLPIKDGKPVPATLDLANDEIDMNFVLGSGTTDGDTHPGEADLDLLRRDLLTMVAPFAPDSPLAGMRGAVNSLPLPFAGKGTVHFALGSVLPSLTITAGVSISDLTLGGNAMPNIDGLLTYDTAPPVLTFGRTPASDELVLDAKLPDNLVLSGGPDPDATAELSGTVTFPLRDKDGKELLAGDLNLDFQAINVDPSLIGLWMRNSQFRAITGQATIIARISGSPANPSMVGSVDAAGLGYGKTAFDYLSAPIFLENDRLIIGRASQEGEGAAIFQLKNAEKPIEFYGYLPIVWLGTLHPDVAMDKPLRFVLKLPEQGLDVVQAYLPQPPEETVTSEVSADRARSTPKPPSADEHLLFALPVNGSWADAIRISLPTAPAQAGTIQGSLEVRGTRLKPEIVNGVFTAEVPEVILPVTDANLPNRLRDVNLDLGFHSTRAGNAWINTLVVNDCSAVYDRDGHEAAPPKSGKFDWLKRLLGTDNREIPFRPGTMVADGAISFNLADERALSADQLDYDLYAKVLRAPLRWRNQLRGTVTSYLHLGNDPKTHHPQIRGVVYAENGHLTYAGAAEGGTAIAPHLPFNPELQVAVQFGVGNVFEITQDNPLYQNTVSATLPFVPTPLFSPIAMADQPYLAGTKRGTDGAAYVPKPPLDRSHLPYQYNAETLQPYAGRGTCAWVTGTLAKPTVEAHFVLVPGKAQVQLPGGTLTVREATGRMVWDPFNEELNPDERLQLFAKGEATGTVDKYTVAMRVDGNILRENRETPPFQFVTLNTPPGMPPLGSSEIQARLTGLTSVADLLRGDRQIMSSLYERAPMFLFGGWFRKAANKLGLETFAFTFDQTMTPEMTVVTSEFGKSRFGSFRLGWTRTYSDLPTWKLWGDYKMPNLKFIRNLSISADTNERGDENINLQYKIEF